MDDKLNKISDKIDKLDDRLDAIDTHMAVYNEQLKIHIKRTELLESDVAPIKDHIAQVRGVSKFVSFTIAVIGVILAVVSYRGV